MQAPSTIGVARQTLIDYLALTKPRIMLLMLATTAAGMWLASKGSPSTLAIFFTLLGTALAIGAASTLNNYFDRNIDAHMRRTQERPLPAGRLNPTHALTFGSFLAATSLILLTTLVNWLSALLAAIALLVYVWVYTLWLKRSTPLGTIIGGIAGGIPPVIGWVAVTGQVDFTALVLFMIVFLWQPSHFWALALLRQDEYAGANLPMLPVVSGPKKTKLQIFCYALALFPITLLLYSLHVTGPVYLFAAILLGGAFLWLTIQLPTEMTAQKRRQALHLFLYSNAYLALLFLAMVLDVRH